MRKQTSVSSLASCNCTFMIVLLIINLTLGAYCFSYSLDTITGKDVAWGWDAIGGLFLGELTIPVALICYIVHDVAGVKVPFIRT